MELRPYYDQENHSMVYSFCKSTFATLRLAIAGLFLFSQKVPQKPQRFTGPFDKVQEPLHALEACVFLRLMGMSFRHEQPCA